MCCRIYGFAIQHCNFEHWKFGCALGIMACSSAWHILCHSEVMLTGICLVLILFTRTSERKEKICALFC